MNNKTKSQSLIVRFVKELLLYKKLTAVAISSIVLGTIVSLYPPYILAIAIDRYLIPGHIEGFLTLSIIYLVLILAQWVLQVVRNYAIELIGQKMVYSLRERLFSKLLNIKIDFFKDRTAGDLISRIINDTSTVVDVFVSGLLNVIGDIVTLMGVFVIMVMLSPMLTLASLASIPLLVIVTKYLGTRMRLVYRDVRRGIGNLTATVEETFSGVEAVKSFNKENLFIRKFVSESLANVGKALQAAVITGFYWSSVGFISSLSNIAVLLVGGYLVATGIVSIGIVVAFTQYVGRFVGPINNIAGVYDRLQLALASLERIYEVLDYPEVEDDKGVEVERLRGEIVFDDVWFEYEKGRPVLKNVSFHIKPGELVAIVGPTGAGKTTLVNLLLKFYEPTRGRILVDGIDIKLIKRSCLRKRISYVPQEVYLFPGTIIDNIKIGKPNTSDEEVIEVCKILGVHEFIEKLPKGYHTDVGEMGKRLSQGERQLIAIARAMLRNPDIVILDEATSSIDPYTDELLRNAIKKLMAGRTGIIIAHRLATAHSCDRVIVVNEGVIGEIGTFDELLDRKGLFYKLYQAQIGRAIVQEYEHLQY